MNIVVACKIVPDDQDIQVGADGSLDFTKAHQAISTYDLNAIESAVQLAVAEAGSTVKAISVGRGSVDDSKVKKNILSRGVDELFLIADDACAELDSRGTAFQLARLVDVAGGADLVIVGDGSADFYAKQTGVHLAAVLDVPYVSGVVSVVVTAGKATCKRLLESVAETVEVSLPAVIAVSPDIALPRIAGMKDILAAGKKPQTVVSCEGAVPVTAQTVSVKAPERTDRRCQIFDATDIEGFAAAVKASL